MDRTKLQILRSPSLKRKQRSVPISERVKLERVLGLTVTSNAALSVDRTTGNIAYPAGCVVVLYNPKKGKQNHIFNSSKKTLTCLAFSGDGKHLVTGESGHQPGVRVWNLEDNTPVAEFRGHKYGVGCVAFSPNLKYIVSIGTQHDMIVNVWNWKTGIKVASNKIASKVTDVAFAEDSSMFVTVGNRHVKFWYLDASKSKIKTETLPLQGRNGILGEHQNNFFCGVCCGKGQTAKTVYAITESGLLCEFDQKRLLVKWVSLRTDRAYAVCLGAEHIFIGCANGLVRIFSAKTLNFLGTLSRPHHLGVDVTLGLPQQSSVMSPDNSRYPDTIALQCDDASNRLTCVYNDHSLYVWDVTDVHKVAKTRSFLFHSGAVWGVDVYPEVRDKMRVLPSGSFATCSSDNTIRIWNCCPNMSTDTPYKRNIYCNELLKVLYIDPDLTNLKDIAYNPAGKTDKTDTSYQDKIGIRSVRFSPDGRHMASGDRAGTLRVHDLASMDQLAAVEAHDSEVLCLEYTQPSTGVNLLATASRDRLLHVFDVDQTYGLIQTLDDHSAAITAVKFVKLEEQLHMLSCGADKSLLFRNAQMDPKFRFILNRHLVSRTTLYDMEVDISGKFVATACQDRNIRIYNTRNGKQKKCYSGSSGTEGTLLRVELDPSGYYAATSCSDKNLSVYDFFAGECVASMYGHSEISPGIKFLNDFKHLVSVSVDGCIFIWRLPSDFSDCMMNQVGQASALNESPIPTSNESRASELNEALDDGGQSSRRATYVVNKNVNTDFPDANRNFPTEPPFDIHGSPFTSDGSASEFYRFSVGQLPSWAKPRVLPGSCEKAASPVPFVASNVAMPKGKWARDVDPEALAAKPLFGLLDYENSPIIKSASYTIPAKVSIVDDDELNQDDEAEDDFSPDKSRLNFMSESFRMGAKLQREISDNSSNSVEDEDEVDMIETPCYMPNANPDSDPSTIDSSFMVQENNLANFKDSSGVEGNEDMTAGEEDETEQNKSRPCTPTDSSKGSEAASPEDVQKQIPKDNFENLYPAHETFEETLKKLEDEVTARLESQSTFRTNRHSISSRFFDKSQAPSLPPSQLSRPLPNQSVPKEPTVRFVDEGKKNTNEARDQRTKEAAVPGGAAGGRRYGRSLGGDAKTTLGFSQVTVTDRSSKRWNTGNTESSSMQRKWKSMYNISGQTTNPAPPSPSKPSRSKTPTLSFQTKTPPGRTISPPRSSRPGAKNDMKLDSSVSYATLPKTRNKAGRQSADTALPSTGILQRSSQMSTSLTLSSSEPEGNHSSQGGGVQQKRKSVGRVQSYRMQTESSMAKLSATGEVPTGKPTGIKKSAVPPDAGKYRSAPNLLGAGEDEEDDADVEENDVNNVDDIKAVKTRILTISARANQFSPIQETDGEQRTPMRNASASDSGRKSVPTVRRADSVSDDSDKNASRDVMLPPPTTTVPTSIQNSFVLKATKYRRSTGGEMTLSQAKNILLGSSNSSSVESVPAEINKQNHLDVSPQDPPVRHTDTAGRVETKGQTKTVSAVGKLSIGVIQKTADRGEQPNVVTPIARIVKIGQCMSPVRASSAGMNEEKLASGFGQRRILPADPKSQSSLSREETRGRSSSAGHDQASLSLLEEGKKPSAAATATAAGDFRVLPTISSTAVLAKSVVCQSPVLGRASPFKMLVSSPDVDSTSSWMKKAQHMQQQWEHRQQRKSVSSAEMIESPSSAIAAKGVINEIERHCEELRMADHSGKADKPTKLQAAVMDIASQVSQTETRSLKEKLDDDGQTKHQQRQQSHSTKDTVLLIRKSVLSFSAEDTLPDGILSSEISSKGIPAASGNHEMQSCAADNRSRYSFPAESKQTTLIDIDSENSYFPNEGEPDVAENLLIGHLKTDIPEISVADSDAGNMSVKQEPTKTANEEECARVASELTSAVTRAKEMYTQLSSDSSCCEMPNSSSHSRALKLLHETLSEARDQLNRTLAISTTNSTAGATCEVDKRMLEMVERYSQQLTTQVYELFKKKLEDDKERL